MNTLTGMEKFSHLEDKIYLTIEFAKKIRDEKESLEREVASLRRAAADTESQKKALEDRLSALLSERDSIQLKVESMLDVITILDADVAEAVGR
ncbi:MAG: hypothetical protein JO053_03805 [Acidobacteria bacterium]|nr:hypothetical protein [Acidobacteriota bacterium]